MVAERGSEGGRAVGDQGAHLCPPRYAPARATARAPARRRHRQALLVRRPARAGRALVPDDNLVALEQKDFLRALPRSWFRGDREYSFKHDLIREVAYEMLPRAERRTLHGRVADWMEHAAGERLGERLDVLAYHAAQAEQHDRAIEYLVRAAARARRAAAHREEVALLGEALAIAKRAERTDRMADLLMRRGKALASLTRCRRPSRTSKRRSRAWERSSPRSAPRSWSTWHWCGSGRSTRPVPPPRGPGAARSPRGRSGTGHRGDGVAAGC